MRHYPPEDMMCPPPFQDDPFVIFDEAIDRFMENRSYMNLTVAIKDCFTRIIRVTDVGYQIFIAPPGKEGSTVVKAMNGKSYETKTFSVKRPEELYQVLTEALWAIREGF